MIETWDKTNTALNLIADAIRDKAKEKPTRKSLAKAKELLNKVNLDLAQILSDRTLK
jgi:hypothetical protein